MIKPTILVAVLALSACAQYDAGSQAARALVANAADAELRYGAYISCVASSLGANGRAHGGTPEQWEALRRACLPQWGLVGAPVPLMVPTP